MKTNKINKKDLLSFSLAIISCFGIAYYVQMGIAKASASILLLPCLWIFCTLWKFCLETKHNSSFYCLTGSLSLLFSALLLFGKAFDLSVSVPFFQLIIIIIFLSIALFPFLQKLTEWLDCTAQNRNSVQPASFRTLVCCFCAVAFIWFLGYLAMFPGMYGYDGAFFYLEYADPSVAISAQWSPVYAGLFYALVEVGYLASGSYVLGFALFSAVQLVFVLFSVWKMLAFLQKYFPTKALVFAGAFFALVPTHVIMAVSSAQDAIFMACFALCLIHFLEMAISPEKYWSKKTNFLAFIIWSIVLCIMRNNGLYALLIVVPFIGFYSRKHRWKFAVCYALILTVTLLYQGPLLDVAGVTKGTSLREMLSMPLQQMACVYAKYPERMTNEQKQALTNYVPADNLSFYPNQPSISDNIKGYLDTSAVMEDPLAFAQLYLQLGLQAPSAYCSAAVGQIAGLIYPDKTYPDSRMWHPYIEYTCLNAKAWNENYIDIQRHSLFPQYSALLDKLLGSARGNEQAAPMAFSSVPFLSVLCKSGTYFWMGVYILFYAIYRRWKEPFLAIGFCIGLSLTIVLSPVILYRYYAPIIFSAPLLISMFFLPFQKNPACEKFKIESKEVSSSWTK